MSSDSTSLVIILVCLVLSAYFSATETAFSTMSHARMKTMADKGDKSAALALQLADNYDTLLSAILIGNNLVNILLSSVATLLFVKFLGEQTGASVATASVTVVVLIFGEISPKSIAKESPEKFAMFSAPFIRALMVLLKPFIWMFAQWKKLLVKLFNKSSDDRGITDEELMTIVEEAEQEGGIDADESTLIRSAIGFMDLETSDIYTPRVDIESIPLDATKEEIAKMFLDTGFSRLPVYEEDIDHIIGIINQKDFHNFIYHTDRPLKDIIEELVGDIWDEHDRVIKEIEKISDREYLMSGSANIDKVFELLDIEKAVDVNTLSGWIMEELGQIPKEGDSFVSDGVKVVVLKMDDHRVDKAKVYQNVQNNAENEGNQEK